MIASGCHYFVTDLSSPNAPDAGYTGEFVIVRVTDGSVVGLGGAFYSEGYDIKGVIAEDRTQLEGNDPYDPSRWHRLGLVWRSAQARFVGWTPVTKDQMSTYSGGNIPKPGGLCA